MNTLDIANYSRIRILEVITVGSGRETEKDSMYAYYPAKIRWCPAEIDKHVALADPENLIGEESIEVLTYCSSAVVEGVYDKIPAETKERKLFEFEETAA